MGWIGTVCSLMLSTSCVLGQWCYCSWPSLIKLANDWIELIEFKNAADAIRLHTFCLWGSVARLVTSLESELHAPSCSDFVHTKWKSLLSFQLELWSQITVKHVDASTVTCSLFHHTVACKLTDTQTQSNYHFLFVWHTHTHMSIPTLYPCVCSLGGCHFLQQTVVQSTSLGAAVVCWVFIRRGDPLWPLTLREWGWWWRGSHVLTPLCANG